jgi:hypothetical protein
VKRTVVSTLGGCIVVHLLRFAVHPTGAHSTKDSTAVKIPLVLNPKAIFVLDTPQGLSLLEDRFPEMPRDSLLAVLNACAGDTDAAAALLHDGVQLDFSLLAVDAKQRSMWVPKNLVGVVVHCGSINSGHYFAYVRDIVRNVWFKCDDNVVSIASEAEVWTHERDVYMAFYE